MPLNKQKITLVVIKSSLSLNEWLLKVIKDDSVFKGSSEQDALVSKMAGGYLILALLIILPLLASGQTLGNVVDTRTISNIREILQSKNRLIVCNSNINLLF